MCVCLCTFSLVLTTTSVTLKRSLLIFHCLLHIFKFIKLFFVDTKSHFETKTTYTPVIK